MNVLLFTERDLLELEAQPFPLRAPRRVWPGLAMAASVAVVVGLAWPQAAAPAPPQPPPVVAVAPPSVPAPAVPLPLPASRDLLAGLLAALPTGGPLTSELDAMGADLAAAARTVRGVVPF